MFILGAVTMRHQMTAAAILCLFTLAAIAAPVMPFNVHSTNRVFQKNQEGGFGRRLSWSCQCVTIRPNGLAG